MSLLDKETVKRVKKSLNDYNNKLKVIVLNSSARTAVEAASKAVLAEVSKIITLCFWSNSFNNLSTLFTGSLSNKVIIQLLIVSYFKHLNIHLCKKCIGVIK